ncbi:sulfotransferase family 2 domain-containing protein [Snuella lapsa]|uniref:Sulfotransferase family 2 domain-containing protein n=1 Tax=Snuella lapsa TaxID=870481 RepID=A0ABP6XN34_9FLAO
MRLKKDEQIESPFFGNYYCLIPNTNIAFLVISKNACTFLKKIAIYNKTGDWLDESQFKVHSTIGYNSNKSNYLFTNEELKAFEKESREKIYRFAIWRDPIHRIESSYKLFCMERELRYYFIYLDINKDIPFERFIEFIRFELGKENPLFIDEHIRKQVDYLKENEVDEIVHINDLFPFLRSKGISFIEEKSNKTKANFQLENEAFINDIKALYKDDYKIEITWKG